MNFLAHCLIPDRALEDTHPDLIAGGFLGDFLKGTVPDHLPATLAEGVRLHRRIDAYSNEHAIIRRSCNRFSGTLRRFAPIIVDVVADHLLARHWQRFHPAPLPSFTARAYAVIGLHAHRLPESGRRFFEYMCAHDLLADYRNTGAMHQGLASVTRRLGHQELNQPMQAAVASHLPGLEEDFLEYFPDLIDHAARWLRDRRRDGARA